MFLLRFLYRQKVWHLYLGLTVLTLGLTWLLQNRIYTLEVLSNLLGSELSLGRIEVVLEMQKENSWLLYLLTPLLLFLKTVFAALLIHMVLTFANKEVTYKSIFKLYLITGLSYVLILLVQVCVLYSVEEGQITQAFLERLTFSLALLVNKEEIFISLYYLFVALNPYEFVYCLIVAGCLRLILVEEKRSTVVSLAILSWGVLTVILVVIQGYMEVLMT